ncbi:Uncharacterised protein [Citrobacter koseri]|nr:Uncharacterised protein [Citrobacter koseri]
MDLTRDNDRLKMDTISASLTLSAEGRRYLLVILDSQSPPLTLNSVSAIGGQRRTGVGAYCAGGPRKESVGNRSRMALESAAAADVAQNCVGKRGRFTG